MLCRDLEAWVWGGEGGSGGNEFIYNYNWFALLYGRNQHKFVKQFSTN